MRRDLAKTTPWIAIILFLCQGIVAAGDEVVPKSNEEAPSARAAEQEVVEVRAPQVAEPKEARLFRFRTYPAAWTAAQKSNRPILVFVTMPQCPHCVKMIEQNFETPEVSKLVASSFETVYVGRFTHAELIEKLQVKWYPTTVLVGPNNKVLDVIEGYVEPKIFQQRLQTGLAAAVPETQTR